MRLYDELSDWWPLMSPPADYAEEAAGIARLLDPGRSGRRLRVLELGAGGGHLAWHLKHGFEMTLVDCAPRMLDLSRRLNPDCRHVPGDMRSLRLDERFDAVLIFDAISHMEGLDDLKAALATARAHLVPGGVGVFCPDATIECFAPQTSQGGSDAGGRGMRYMEWVRMGSDGASCETDIVYLLRAADGRVLVAHDHARFGLFPRALWCAALDEAGFEAVSVETQAGRDVFTARAR
ncbi:class I SAM-dependent methyltransferase [Rhodovulum strictum]|uniref:Methyltransferase domain-containing protein n=1 Tax=Rhodovulum strictum TaxID=58314 RepID=A0A844BDE0_9RHOB|nr:class I SAM-dependent methyltransferase [Rhodovulum strictum]MRH20618.1 methyltransferase domain-containing protein [Rhodovulum strictum]